MVAISDPCLAHSLLSEISVVEQLSQSRLKRALPKGMELSHFVVLSHFTRYGGDETPAKLARKFHVTKGAMTNTLTRLEKAGYIDIRPDWDDGRRKRVSIKDEGIEACQKAHAKVEPVLQSLTHSLGEDRMKSTIPLLQQIRRHFDPPQ